MSRKTWADREGVPEGSDFTLEAVLTTDGAIDPSQVTSSGLFTLSIENTVQPGAPLLADEANDAISVPAGLVTWNISAAQSSSWPAGTFNGDIKLVDSGGTVTYWPVSLKVRGVID